MFPHFGKTFFSYNVNNLSGNDVGKMKTSATIFRGTYASVFQTYSVANRTDVVHSDSPFESKESSYRRTALT